MIEAASRIRRCTPRDARAIAAIYDPIVALTAISFEEVPPGPNEIARRISMAGDRYPWLIFERNDAVAGYVYASAHRTRAAYQWSVDVSVYIAESARRGGIARRLYLRLFDMLARQGYRTAFAGVALPNEASVELHRSLGFTTVGVYHRVGFKMGEWRDVMWLELRLPGGDAAPSEPMAFDERWLAESDA